MDKKFIYIAGGAFAVIIILIIVLVSFGGKKSSSTNTGSGYTTLTIWGTEESRAAFDQIIYYFERENRKVKVVYEQKDPANYLSETLNALAGDSGPDIWAIPNDWVAQYRDKLIALSYDSLKEEKRTGSEVYKSLFPFVVAQDNLYDDGIYGMPLTVNTLGLYCNMDLFNKTWSDLSKLTDEYNNTPIETILKNGPTNWDELVLASALLTRNEGANITQSGIALGTSNNIPQAADIITLLMLQNGAVMTSDNGTTAQFHFKENRFGGTDFPGLTALDFYTSFANSKSEFYSWNKDMPQAVRAFADGKVAMMIDYPAAASELYSVNPNLNYKFLAMPQIKETKYPLNYAHYETYTVTKASKNPELAWSFVMYMALNDKAAELYNRVTEKTPANLLLGGNRNSQAQTAISWYKPEPAQADKALIEMITQVNDGVTLKTALESAAAKISNLLRNMPQ